MEALAGAPIDEKIRGAKVASIPLDRLRAHATQAREATWKSGDRQAEARWTEVIRLIDASLEEDYLAEQQRSLWTQESSKRGIAVQRTKVGSLEERLAHRERLVAQLRDVDGRTEEERRKGEPAHPPWTRINELTLEIEALREEIAYEKRVLRDSEKGAYR
jgi:hypothetical protein